MERKDKRDKFQEQATVLAQCELAPGVYSLWIQTEHIAGQAKPGQFLSVYCDDGSRLLPRPISICEIDRGREALRLVYRIAGKGTDEFSKKKAGDTLRVTGPLGNGFPPGNDDSALAESGGQKKNRKAFLIGGGIGIPPLLELAKQLDCEKEIILGYRDSNLFLLEDFIRPGSTCTLLQKESDGEQGNTYPVGQEKSEAVQSVVYSAGRNKSEAQNPIPATAEKACGIYIATEDGSVGTKGNVLDAIRANALTADVIYACGPTPMLRALKAYAQENNIECWISLEERMACGIGACLACVCKSVEVDGHTNVHNKRICKEGPVFNAREVEL